MKAHFFVNDLTNSIVLFAAIMALLTQAQIRKIIPVLSRVDKSRLRTWHRLAGWIALGCFVINMGMGLIISTNPLSPLKPHHFAHSVLLPICAVAILSEIHDMNRKVYWIDRRALLGYSCFYGSSLFHVGKLYLSCPAMR